MLVTTVEANRHPHPKHSVCNRSIVPAHSCRQRQPAVVQRLERTLQGWNPRKCVHPTTSQYIYPAQQCSTRWHPMHPIARGGWRVEGGGRERDWFLPTFIHSSNHTIILIHSSNHDHPLSTTLHEHDTLMLWPYPIQ